MSTNSETDDWLIQLLEKELALFDDDTCPLLLYQIDAFNSYYRILCEDEKVLENRPKQRRSERQRVRNIVTDIFVTFGPELFVLCTLAIPVSRLSTITQRDVFPKLRTWWKAIKLPTGLSETAAETCKAKSIDTLVTSYRKRKLSELSPVEERTTQAEKASKICDDNERQYSDASPSTTPSSQPPPTVIDLTFTELLGFFHENQGSSPKLQMICPLFGSPLPSIDIKLDSSMERAARIDFSLRASEALIKHVRLSRALGVPKVSD